MLGKVKQEYQIKKTSVSWRLSNDYVYLYSYVSLARSVVLANSLESDQNVKI